MPDEPGSPQTQTINQPPPGAAAPSVPEDYEELKAFRATYEPVLNNIAPHWDDIAPIIEDESEREYWRAAREARKVQREAQKPQLTPELKLIRDEFAGELQPLVEYVKGQRAAQEQATQYQQQAAMRVNYDYAQRLVAEHPELAEGNYAGINAYAQLAFRDQTSLEESYKKYSGYLSGPPPKREPPPSLRAGAAAPGVPGESTRPKPRGKAELRQHWAETLRKASR